MLSDADSVVRSEVRLIEAKFVDRFQRLDTGLVFAVLGMGAFALALALFVVTIVYEIRDTFPSVPIWAVTGIMSVLTCLLGGSLLTGLPHLKPLKENKDAK